MAEVHINGCLAHAESTDKMCMEHTANQLNSIFKIDVLKRCGVDAYVCITGIESAANDVLVPGV